MKPAKQTVRVVREWSITAADYTYATYIRTHWRDDVYTLSRKGEGDKEWADKNADHFGVEIGDVDPTDEWWSETP